MDFSSLGLEPVLLKALRALDYEQPTPIQEQAIPPALAGRDIIGCAQTGTGKTVAFILPALQHMLLGASAEASKSTAASGGHTGGDPKRSIKALVVTPTRELAGQIEEVARDCARYTGQRVAAVYGGVGYEPQLGKLRRGVDLLVATPGRLLDLQNRGDVNLGHVEMLVLDEADRMLDMGFWPDVQRILRLLPEKRQNMLFSATLSNEVRRLASVALDEPLRVEVAPSATPVNQVRQVVYPVNALQKTDCSRTCWRAISSARYWSLHARNTGRTGSAATWCGGRSIPRQSTQIGARLNVRRHSTTSKTGVAGYW